MRRYYVTDRKQADVIECARRAVADGVDMIQVREKDMDARGLLELATTIVRIAHGSATRVLVNDRLDVALAADAHGVHLPSDGLPVTAVRPLIALVGISTHSLDDVQRAETDGADFVVFGPLFETPGKTAIGLDRLTRVASGTDVPVYGIGGITIENAGSVITAGAVGIAGIRLFQT
jgi:thiamine-phosphate pyrophosphorylase